MGVYNAMMKQNLNHARRLEYEGKLDAYFTTKEPPMTKIQQTLDERGQAYGEFAELAVKIQNLKGEMGHYDNSRLSCIHQEALDMICTKIGRILNGNPNHVDSWKDIAGYAQLVVNYLEGRKT